MVSERVLFGTNGIRGVPGSDLTLEFVVNVSEAIGTYFDQGPILVGHDGRHSSPTLSRAVAAGLMAVGLDVVLTGMVTTPALQYGVRKLDYRGGVMVTASHNPPQYNGVKVLAGDGVEISREDEGKIERIYFDEAVERAGWDETGSLGTDDRVLQSYIEGTLTHVTLAPKKRLKVVLDPGNGVAALTAPPALSKAGCKVETINGQIDGAFSGRGPEPTPASLDGLSKEVRSSGADLGIAYDGDGDRAIFCDEKGAIHTGDRSGALLVDHVLTRNPGALVVTTVSTSQIVDYIAKKHHSKVLRTKVGSVDVSRCMVDHDALIGLEENGGFFYAPHIPVRDGLMTSLLLLEALSINEAPLSEVMTSLPTLYQMKTKLECPHELKGEVMEEIVKSSSGRIERIDGVKVWLEEETWMLLRPSGTEPLIRVFGESNDRNKLEGLMSEYSSLVGGIIKKIKGVEGS